MTAAVRFKPVWMHELSIPVLAAGVLGAGVLMQVMGQLNHDVAFLSWAAREMLHGAVLGRDLVEVNFPLAILIYAPAAWASALIPFPTAIRLWVLLVGLLAIGLAWRDLPARQRAIVLFAFSAYAGFAWPREFGQREHLALMLVFPYVIPGDRRGARAIVVGAMAAIGFAVKPPLLLAWLAVELGKPLMRTEQVALVCAGVLYATSMLTVFHEFTFGMIATTLDTYAASDRIDSFSFALIPSIAALMATVLSWWSRDALAKSFAAAAIGFLAAAIVQMKFYNYHFVATCGFSVLSLVVAAQVQVRLLSGLALGALVLFLSYLYMPVRMWWSDAEGKMASAPHLMSLLDGAHSFLAVGVHPYPAFPTALYAEESGVRYVGVACCTSFLAAAAAGHPEASRLARAQLLRELRRLPDVVLVDTNWQQQTNIPRDFDGLAWFLEDPELRSAWGSYELYAEGGPYRFYRRKGVELTRAAN